MFYSSLLATIYSIIYSCIYNLDIFLFSDCVICMHQESESFNTLYVSTVRCGRMDNKADLYLIQTCCDVLHVWSLLCKHLFQISYLTS